MQTRALGQTPPWLAVAVLSAATLGYEVLLTRLFAIVQWHHFAYMIISLALLGYGMSGTFLAIIHEQAGRRFTRFFATNAALFGATAPLCFGLAQRVPFNPLEIGWNPHQLLHLFAIYLLLTVPFFATANAIGLALLVFRRETHRVYAADLVGAGFGATAVVGALFVLPAQQTLLVIAAAGFIAACLTLRSSRGRIKLAALTLLALLLATFAGPLQWLQPLPTPYKALQQALQVTGAQQIATIDGPLGTVTALRNELVPPRHAPGLSLSTGTAPPEQIGLFLDGQPIGAISRFADQQTAPAFLDQMSSALPYHLHAAGVGAGPRVLVLGAGGGTEVLQALSHGAVRIDAVELNANVVVLVRDTFGEFAGGLYAHPYVHVHIAEPRGFAAADTRSYEIIQVALLEAFGAAAAGLHSLQANYLYTVEGLQTLIARLAPGGMLSLTRWVQEPPRDILKLFATTIDALQKAGVVEPDRHLALIRGWNTTTLVLSRRPFEAGQIEALKRFTRNRSFDLSWYPGMQAAEANRYNITDQPYLFDAASALLSEQRQQYTSRYKFDIEPASDDRPYFFHFAKWRTIQELLALAAGAGLAQLEWGHIVLLATVSQALLASILLITLPLWIITRRNRSGPTPPLPRRRLLSYFLAIGLAFMFMEIAFIQKFVLFLSHPLYAIAVVLAAFLVFAGLGSAASKVLARLGDPRGAIWLVSAAIMALTTVYLMLLGPLFGHFVALAEPLKIVLSVVLVAPLAFLMGMPFPHGLRCLRGPAAALVPWAWAINGCASVVSAALATALSMEIGFSGIVLAAVILYAVAAASLPQALPAVRGDLPTPLP